MIAPTVDQATRASSQTAVLDEWTAIHATMSSKAETGALGYRDVRLGMREALTSNLALYRGD